MKRERTIVAKLSILALCFACAILVEARSDCELSAIIGERLWRYDQGYMEALPRLFSECGSDSNVFSQVAINAYERYPRLDSRLVALTILRMYGTKEQIPFLESCAKSPERDGLAAIKALTRIESISDRTIMRVRDFNEKAQCRLRMEACEFLVDSVLNRTKDDELIVRVLDYLRSLGADERFSVFGIDRLVQRLDPRYKYSSQRLAVLREAFKVATHENDRKSLEKEINRLEIALPERDAILRKIRELLKNDGPYRIECAALIRENVDSVLNGLDVCASNLESRRSVLAMSMGDSANDFYQFLETVVDLAERKVLARDELLWCLKGNGHFGRPWVLASRYQQLDARILTIRLMRQAGDDAWGNRILKGQAKRDLETFINDGEGGVDKTEFARWLELERWETKDDSCGIR